MGTSSFKQNNVAYLSVINLNIQCTCALREAWDVRISKGVLTLQCVSEHAQSGSTDDCYLGSVLCLGHQPVSCLLEFVMTTDTKKKE